MPRPKGARGVKPPAYRLHRRSGRAIVTIDSKDHYLGPHGSPESRAEYDRLVAEWLVRGRRAAPPATAGPTVNEVIAQYWAFAQTYYVKNGRPTTEPEAIRHSLKPLRRLYGRTAARDFGPLALEAVRADMIGAGLCRNEVNKRVGRIVRAWKWAVSRELVPASAHEALRTLSGLRKGRSLARETEPVHPAPEADIHAAAKKVLPPVRAMIELQLLTGMRPGEVCSLRGADLDRSGPVWVYTPAVHKTEHHGKHRRIYLGPKAQEVVTPWLRAEPDEYLFSPREAVEADRADRRAKRKTRVQPSQAARKRQTKPRRAPGDRCTPYSYRWAVRRACVRAGVPPWHPHQLRHNAATRLRAEFGLDVARTVLGHASQAVTEIYAEADFAKARDAMSKAG